MASTSTVIFDFDGTLVDSFALAFRLTNEFARRYGFKQVSEEDIPFCKELPLRDFIKHLEVPMHKLPVIIAKARAEMRKEITSIKLFKGMGAALEKLKKAGLQLGIVTSNSRVNVRECLSFNGVLGHFDFIHSASNLFGKHRILRHLLKKQHLSAENVIYVGDEARDIEASKKCRVPVVAVGWGFQSLKRLRSMNPDFLASNPLEIVTFVLERVSKREKFSK